MAKRTAAGTLALAVCLSGGALAFAGAANADSGFKFNTAIAGATRYDTAIAAAEKAFPTGSKSVVIVNAQSTVDGLTASYIAGLHNAPILYTDANSTPAKTTAEMQKLGVTTVYVVGGTSVVSQSQLDTWKGAGLSVTTYAGSDRYGTAAAAADAVSSSFVTTPTSSTTVFVASGEDGHLADALAVGPIAYSAHDPILLTKAGSVPDATAAELTKLNKTTVVIGGTSVVSDSTLASVKGSKRLAGANRAQTATQVADWAIANAGFKKTGVALVGSGNNNAADALVAAPVAGSYQIPVLFAGAAETAAYLSLHAADLTGTGEVFGGTSAVPQSAIDAATTATKSPQVTAQGFMVTALPTGSSTAFSYADPVQKKAVKVTPASTDKFTVAGSPATQGAFVSALQIGGTVSIAPSPTTGGPITYSYTPAPSTGFWSGLVGAYNTGSHSLSIVEPVTGVALNAVSDYTFGSNAYTVFTVDGQAVSQAIFESSLSMGDSVTFTGTGADISHIRTVALTSGSLTGTVASTSVSSGILSSFTVTTSSGATLTQSVTPGSGDTYSIDGGAAAYGTFIGTGNTATTKTPVSVGDQITYSRAGGIQKFALVNSAPSNVSGVVALGNGGNVTNGSGVAYYSPAGTLTSTAYSGVSRFVVDGVVSSQNDFVAAVTPGDWITYQAGDTTTNTTATLSLTNKPLTGTVAIASGTTSSSHTVVLLDSDGDLLNTGATVPGATGVAYNSYTSVFGTAGTSVAYSIDGTTSTLAQFDAMISRISQGSRQGSVQVSLANGVVTWSLATTAFSTAPTITGVSFGHASSGTLVVTLNKPVTDASAANSDWTISINGGTPTLTGTPSISGNTISFTVSASAATLAAQAIVVAPASSTVAASYTDSYGTAMGAGSFTGTTS